MTLANYMYSPVGYGEYGDEPTAGEALSEAALVDVSRPAELRGARLTAGLSIKPQGDQYRVGVELPLAGFVGLHTISGDEPVTVSLNVPGPAKAILGKKLSLRYIPPRKGPIDLKLVALGGLALVLLVALMRRKS